MTGRRKEWRWRRKRKWEGKKQQKTCKKTDATEARSYKVFNQKTNCIKRSLNTSHTHARTHTQCWRNDSPQRSCNSLALGLPTSRGGWQGPGGTAGVWTCSVSDSLRRKTTLQLNKKKKKKKRWGRAGGGSSKKKTISPPPLCFPHTYWVQIVIFRWLISPIQATTNQERGQNVNAAFRRNTCLLSQVVEFLARRPA